VLLREFVSDGGAGLRVLLNRISSKVLKELHFPKVHPTEQTGEFLQVLGFRPSLGHMLYATRAQSE
jgi:hypothetical protein